MVCKRCKYEREKRSFKLLTKKVKILMKSASSDGAVEVVGSSSSSSLDVAVVLVVASSSSSRIHLRLSAGVAATVGETERCLLVQVVIRSESFASLFRQRLVTDRSAMRRCPTGRGRERLRRGGAARRSSSKRGKESERKNCRARRRGVIDQRRCGVSG